MGNVYGVTIQLHTMAMTHLKIDEILREGTKNIHSAVNKLLDRIKK